MFLKVFGVSSAEVVLDEKLFKVFGVPSAVVILEETIVDVFGECCRNVVQFAATLSRCRIVVQFAESLTHCGTVCYDFVELWCSLLRRRRIVVQFAATSSHCGTVCCGSPFAVVIESCWRGGGCFGDHVPQECKAFLADRFSRLESIAQHLRDLSRAAMQAAEADCSRCAFVAIQTPNSVLGLLFRIRIGLCYIHSSHHRI